MVSQKDKVYDDLVYQIDNYGRFQKVYNYLYNFVFMIFATTASFNIILALAVPEHWCHVPGRKLTNFTSLEWKELYIPWHYLSNTTNETTKVFSECKMYVNKSTTDGATVAECQYGYDYNKTWYYETIASRENWVCDKEFKVTEAFTFSRCGDIIGAVFFGYIGDKFGRFPSFYLSIVTLLVGRTLSIFFVNYNFIFNISLFLGNLSSLAVFQCVLTIAIEISKDKDRNFISMLQCISWTVGLCLLPFIFWIFKHWYPFMLITTLPLIVFLIPTKFMIESPRWLASQGRSHKCFKEMKKIAKVNKVEIKDEHLRKLNEIQDLEDDEGDGTSASVWDLFSTWAMFKITVLSIIGWISYIVIYGILYLNVTNLNGNPFLNFFWQGLAELPGYIIGKYLVDSIGRRHSRTASYLAATLASLILIIFINFDWVVAWISVFLKITTSITFYALNLHSLEIFPTKLRQTGISLCIMSGSILSLASPSIVYLGTSLDARIPYVVIVILGLAATILGIFLPETLYQKLPESVEEAANFGKGQSLWKLPKKYQSCSQIDNIKH